MAAKKDLNVLRKKAEAQKWSVVPTRNGHLRWTGPNGGGPYFSSSTPSDSKAVKNIEMDLRKRGLLLT